MKNHPNDPSENQKTPPSTHKSANRAKQIKQTLQLADFFGQSANAVRWQIWSALLVYLLLRVQAFLNRWQPSFNRLVTLIRSALWLKLDLLSLLHYYGTAGVRQRFRAAPEQAYLPGFA